MMHYKEYGKGNPETMIFLHGGGLSWWNYREEAELVQERYHVVLPILDGHAGSGHPFTSLEENAKEIIAWIDQNCAGPVLLIGGLSLGAQIVLEILSQRKDICRYALVESAAVIPSKLTSALIAPAFGSSYGLVKNRGFAKLQFASLKIKEELFEDYYRDTCRITKEDMIAFMKANTAYVLKEEIRKTEAQVFVYAGEKETGEIRKSVLKIKEALPECTVRILPGLYHGEFSLNHADLYVEEILKIVSAE